MLCLNMINRSWRMCGVLFLLVVNLRETMAAMTQKQLIQSMDMMKGVCRPKFPNLSDELLDGIRRGEFPEGSKDLKCYTTCIAQMAGTITKKKEISAEKTISQMETMLPPELKQKAIDAILACKHIQSEYKDLCDKTFYSTKCARDFHPEIFMFP